MANCPFREIFSPSKAFSPRRAAARHGKEGQNRRKNFTGRTFHPFSKGRIHTNFIIEEEEIMKRTHKLFSLLLALVMALSLAACGGDGGSNSGGTAPAQNSGDSGAQSGGDSAGGQTLT